MNNCLDESGAIFTPMDGVNVNALYGMGYYCWLSLPMDWMGLIGEINAEK
jgi:hypothetical protein